jgi:hypothetical protein
METIIGFVAGYLVGVNGGRDGLQRVRSSWQAIRTSPEVRRLLSEGAAVAQVAVSRASRGGLGEALGGVTDLIAARAAGSRGLETKTG